MADAIPESESESDRIGSRPGSLMVRLGVVLLVGSVVAVLAFVKAWLDYSDTYGMNREYYHANAELQRMGRDIEMHITDRGTAPESLQDLDTVSSGFIETDENGKPIDPWGHPYQYVNEGEQFQLWSFGYDGRPGGIGMNADLYYKGGQDWIPTFEQFLTIRGTGGIQFVCAGGGFFAAIATWLLLRPSSLAKSSFRATLILLAITIGMSVVGAAFVAFVHVPSGH